MTKRAIDVVLLLPPPINRQATELNQRFDGEEIDFTETDMIPHVTLLMGGLDDRDLDAARELLAGVAQGFGPLPLRITGIRGRGASVSYELEKGEMLQRLHRELLSALVPVLTYDVSEAMFYKPAEVRQNAVAYVRKFREEASHDLYWPHITLGHGQNPEPPINEEADIPFTGSRLAMCHLGRHCTCREILAEVSLG